jgi:hypothetical protein
MVACFLRTGAGYRNKCCFAPVIVLHRRMRLSDPNHTADPHRLQESALNHRLIDDETCEKTP